MILLFPLCRRDEEFFFLSLILVILHHLLSTTHVIQPNSPSNRFSPRREGCSQKWLGNVASGCLRECECVRVCEENSLSAENAPNLPNTSMEEERVSRVNSVNSENSNGRPSRFRPFPRRAGEVWQTGSAKRADTKWANSQERRVPPLLRSTSVQSHDIGGKQNAKTAQWQKRTKTQRRTEMAGSHVNGTRPR